jgi:prophage antirepressor-like protein/ribosomal protein L21E
MTSLILVKSDTFGEIECNFWRNKQGEILITREQIGSALGYAEPRKAIANLHERNIDRLEKFSVVLKLRTTDGKLYDTYAYTAKGIYEICRFSRQPKADIFMDWVWDVIETIRKTGSYSTKRNSFPWMDSLGVTLRQETKLSKELSKPEKLRLRARLLRQTQEETGHDYTDIISILVNSADNQEQKIIQSETKAVEAEVRREARRESSTVGGQAKQALAWVREEYAKRGEKLAIIHEDWLLVRYDMWKMWAGRNKFNLTLVLRELHRQGVVEITSEGAKQRYATKKRFEGKLFSVVWVKREAVEKATNVIQFSELTTR